MSSEKFIKNNTALITLIAACLVVLISLGVRQVFGMFFMVPNEASKGFNKLPKSDQKRNGNEVHKTC